MTSGGDSDSNGGEKGVVPIQGLAASPSLSPQREDSKSKSSMEHTVILEEDAAAKALTRRLLFKLDTR
jgi:hypothetical protein